MHPISERHGAVIKQAIEWHQRLGQGEMDPDSRRELNAWLQSPDHVEELARICLIDALIQHAPIEHEARPALPGNVIDFRHYAPTARARPLRPPEASTIKPRFTTKIAIVATSVVAVLGALIAGVFTENPDIVTREGHWDKQLLDDGSVVYVGPNTKLQFDFGPGWRAVTLVRGEALFEVAKDPGRPFIVNTDVGSVQAIGTAFATKDVGDDVLVTVASGKVGVSSAVAGTQPMRTLGANQQVMLSSIGVSEPMAVDAERELTWVRNWYEYHGEQLGEIIEQLNSRNKAQIVVDDSRITRLQVSSLAFRPSQPQEFVTKVNRWYAGDPRKGGDPAGRRGDVLRLQRP